MKIILNVDRDKFTVEELLNLEDAVNGERSISSTVSVIKKCMVDGNGKQIPPAKALEIIKKLSIEEYKEVSIALFEKVREMLNPPNGTSNE